MKNSTSKPRLPKTLRRVSCSLLALMASPLNASTLQTANCTITIEAQCPEGEVSCDEVSYLGVSKRTGASISLLGTTLHSECKDGSPCRFQGYEFRSGTVVYRVYEDGMLEVSDGSRVLVSERGEWDL